MIHRHLDYSPTTPVVDRGRAALDDLLDRGDLEEWAPLAKAVTADPAGPLASTVLEICAAHPMYGTSRLWAAWIEGLRRGEDAADVASEGGASLAELRVLRGLRQVDVAARLGSSQSDVSKTESRGDLRLSTLRAYVAATGGRLECRAVYPDGEVELTAGPQADVVPAEHLH